MLETSDEVSDTRIMRDGFSVKIVRGGLYHPQIVELLQIHFAHARTYCPPDGVHALDQSDLGAPEVDFWSAWSGGQVLGFAALKRISADHGEIKSLRVAETSRRRGVATCLLQRVVDVAATRGMRRLSLETGTGDESHAARSLYHRFGFSECGPFGDYSLHPMSVFMSLDL